MGGKERYLFGQQRSRTRKMRLRHEKNGYVCAVKMTEKNNEEDASFLRLCFSVIPNIIASLSLSLSLSHQPFVPPYKSQSTSYLTDDPYPSETTVLRYPPRVSENAVSKAWESLLNLDRPRRKRHSDIATSARQSLCHRRLSVMFAFWHGVVAKINRQLLTRSSHSSVARGPLAVAVQFARGSARSSSRAETSCTRCRDVVGAKTNSDSRRLFLETELRELVRLHTFCPRVHRTGFRRCLVLDSCREKWERTLSFRF